MELCALTAISPVDGRYEAKTRPLRGLFSEMALMRQRIFVEVRWFLHLAQCKQMSEIADLSDADIAFLNEIVNHFDLSQAQRIKEIEKTTQHDVKAIEYFLKEQFDKHPSLKPYQSFIHFACTSDDINNLAYALSMKAARDTVLLPQIDAVIMPLKKQIQLTANMPMLARTHGQAATPTSLGKEFANVLHRLQAVRSQLLALNIKGKMNGAIGNYNAHRVAYPDIDWPKECETFVKSLGLDWNAFTTQIEPHDDIATVANTLSHLHSIAIDLCRDCWSYISIGYFKLASISSETGSSTMPHKVNPIDFENAEGNFSFANALLRHFASELTTSRWQRDLTDSTLLRNLGVAFSHSLIALQSLEKGLTKIEANETIINQDLEQHWEVITEAIQTVMRRYGMTDAYEQLKTLSRGKTIDKKMLHDFINTLNIPEKAKQQLLQLTPKTYTGYAETLAKSLL